MKLGKPASTNLEALIEAALLAEQIIGSSLGGRIMHSGSPKRYRMLRRLENLV